MENVFVDDSCSKPSDGIFPCGYSVCSFPDTVWEAHSFPFNSAQASELVDLTRACQLFADEPVSIYHDSRYAFGVVHDFGKIWHAHGFCSANGKPISHFTLIADLTDACTNHVAVIKVKGHDTCNTQVAQGNGLADELAK